MSEENKICIVQDQIWQKNTTVFSNRHFTLYKVKIDNQSADIAMASFTLELFNTDNCGILALLNLSTNSTVSLSFQEITILLDKF